MPRPGESSAFHGARRRGDSDIEGIPVSITYVIEKNCFAPYKIEVNGTVIENITREENLYRDGGLCVELDELLSLLSTDRANVINIFM